MRPRRPGFYEIQQAIQALDIIVEVRSLVGTKHGTTAQLIVNHMELKYKQNRKVEWTYSELRDEFPNTHVNKSYTVNALRQTIIPLKKGGRIVEIESRAGGVVTFALAKVLEAATDSEHQLNRSQTPTMPLEKSADSVNHRATNPEVITVAKSEPEVWVPAQRSDEDEAVVHTLPAIMTMLDKIHTITTLNHKHTNQVGEELEGLFKGLASKQGEDLSNTNAELKHLLDYLNNSLIPGLNDNADQQNKFFDQTTHNFTEIIKFFEQVNYNMTIIKELIPALASASAIARIEDLLKDEDDAVEILDDLSIVKSKLDELLAGNTSDNSSGELFAAYRKGFADGRADMKNEINL